MEAASEERNNNSGDSRYSQMPLCTRQFAAHVLFNLFILADFILGVLAVVDVGVINSPVNDTVYYKSERYKARYFASVAVNPVLPGATAEFMEHLNRFAIPQVVLAMSVALLSAAAVEYNRATLPQTKPDHVVGTLRVFVAWYFFQPMETAAAILYLRERSNGFDPRTLCLLLLLLMMVGTVPRFLELRAIPTDQAIFKCKVPLWARRTAISPPPEAPRTSYFPISEGSGPEGSLREKVVHEDKPVAPEDMKRKEAKKKKHKHGGHHKKAKKVKKGKEPKEEV